ncbi:MAG: FecR domain-containing protein, partial [Anaerolineae bacterium]
MEEDRTTLNDFLVRYPELTLDVRALLELAEQVRRVPQPISSPEAFAAGKRQMLQALAEQQRQQTTSSGLFERYKIGLATFAERWMQPVVRRRAFAFGMSLAILSLMLLGLALVLHPWLGDSVARVATLEGGSGVVEVLPAGGDAWQRVLTGARVEAGDRLRTGPESTVQVVFFDGSTTDLVAETELTIAQLSSKQDGSGKIIVLHQWLGRTYNHVQPLLDADSRFEIKTPAAVTAVRGTKFALGVEEDGTTQVVVVEGQVDVKAQE